MTTTNVVPLVEQFRSQDGNLDVIEILRTIEQLEIAISTQICAEQATTEGGSTKKIAANYDLTNARANKYAQTGKLMGERRIREAMDAGIISLDQLHFIFNKTASFLRWVDRVAFIRRIINMVKARGLERSTSLRGYCTELLDEFLNKKNVPVRERKVRKEPAAAESDKQQHNGLYRVDIQMNEEQYETFIIATESFFETFENLDESRIPIYRAEFIDALLRRMFRNLLGLKTGDYKSLPPLDFVE
ncbi:MAG: hypothetical protein Q3962_03125 [Corynebacterium sp.]|nr:hypothetical protein [Corynebacterium sp.]